MKNFLILLSISLTLYLSAALFKIYYESKVYNKTFIADLSSEEKLIGHEYEKEVKYVGTIGDSYSYIKRGYWIYKEFKLLDYNRPQIAFLFAIFMFIFNKYFLLAMLLFNTILFSVSLTILLNLLNPNKLLFNLILLLFTFAFTFYFVPLLMPDPIIASIILISLIFLKLNRKKLTLISLFIASILRPEFVLIILLFGIFLKSLPLSLLLSIITLTPQIILNKYLDQSRFYSWSLKGYYIHIKNMKIQDANKHMEEIWNNCESLNKDDCYKRLLIKAIKEDYDKVIPFAIKNAILNPIKLLFFPIDRYSSGKQKILYPFYIVLSILYSIMLIISILKQKNEKLILYSIITLSIIISSIFILNPTTTGYPGFASRFKIFLIPFEIYLIAKTFATTEFKTTKL
ncbi:MAG: hypothetical protein ABIL52_08510 [candidate division WOR-3 bacterium]